VTEITQCSGHAIISPAGILPRHSNNQFGDLLSHCGPPGTAAVFRAAELLSDQLPWSDKQIRKYDRQARQVVKTVSVSFHPDNISIRADGMLVVAGMDELASCKACVLAKRNFCETGFTVVTLDPVILVLLC
jgi:hypothetical protein